MADSKISALPASTTPLAGTEVLPIVQSSTTKQVSVANLTAGRAISATQLTLTTGNLIVANGQGIDFSATPGTGTSELLADYEEGTWTPSFVGSGSYPWTFTITNSIYTKVGRLVYVNCYGTMTATGTTTADNFYIGGVPFASANCKSAGQVTIDSASDTVYFLAASNLFSYTAVIPATLAANSRSFALVATYSV
jgi:hypothetical protein